MAADEKDELRNQVVAQCMAVAGLAHTLAVVHNDKAVMFALGDMSSLIEMNGERTARFMEILGDILNGMDAVTEEDARFDATFEAAHKRWPVEGCPHCRAHAEQAAS